MGISKQQAAHNREAIIGAAEKLFREKGVDAVGLNDLMDAAGFTRGGFYNHFKSKDALVAAVMDKAMQEGAAALDAAIAGSRAKGRDPLEGQIEWYLSPGHRADVEHGCPLSGFAGDVRRLDDAARERYARGLETNLAYFTDIVAKPGESPAVARARAVAVFSEMLGALLLSRAVAVSAPTLSDEILKSGRRSLRAATGDRRKGSVQTSKAAMQR
ncbi:MAG: bacterial regulatory s, tetR family protein [Nevskia sp.]|nr:bacterial regulatory s, tetR family protein [Nevskia sp.]